MKHIYFLTLLVIGCSGCDKDSNDGDLHFKWKHQLYAPNAIDNKDSRSATLPIVIGNLVYMTYRIDSLPYTHLISAFDINDGELKWSYQTNRQIEAECFKHDGTYLYINLDDSVICLDPNDGHLIWGADVEFDAGWGQITLGDDFILHGHGYYEQPYSKLFKINKANGNIIWRKIFSYNNQCLIMHTGYDPLTRYCYVSLRIEPDNILGNQSEIICLNDSNIVWRKKYNWQELAGPSSVFMIQNEKLLFSTGTDFWALNKTTGDSIWRYKDQDGVFDAPMLLNNHIYTSNINGYFYCINATTGKLTWKVNDFCSLSKTLSHDDEVVYGCDGYLWAFDQQTGKIQIKMNPPGHNTDDGNVFLGPVGVGSDKIFVVGTRAIYCYNAIGNTE